MRRKLFVSNLLSLVIIFVIADATFANPSTLETVRVFYREDGRVAVLYVLASSCDSGESEIQCLDRVADSTPNKDLPYDDIQLDQLPKDRKNRDKWLGEKGRGIWVDTSLVTKSEKIEELQEKLDAEVDKDSPNPAKVVKLQRQIEKAQKINRSVLTPEDLAQFEEKQKSLIAAAAQAVGDLFSGILEGIKNGFLALKNLVVGSPEKPSGITTYDHKTGQPYCLIVRGGKVESVPGTCENLNSYVIASDSEAIYDSGEIATDPSDPRNDGGDTEPPVIQINGLNPAEIPVGERYSDLGATVTDNKDQNLGYKVILSSVIASSSEAIYPHELSIDTSVPAEYAITYIAVDQAGNRGTASRTVIVFDPNANSGTSEVQNIETANLEPTPEPTLTPEPAPVIASPVESEAILH